MQPTDIQSPGQLLAAALVAERDANKHYADLAARMRHYGNRESAELFERLAGEGREREQKILEWSELEQVQLPELTEPVAWEDPLMPTTYDAEARDPYRSTPYKALAYAAHNTDRAFHLYTHISATAGDPHTERYAKILAGDALNRSRLLQSRRRRAYHSEHRGERQRQLDTALQLKTLTGLLAVSAGIETHLAGLLAAMAEHYADLAPLAVQSSETAARCHARLNEVRVPAVESDDPCDTSNIGTDLHQDVLMIFTVSERAFNFYDTVMGHAYDEAIMLEAQHLSEAALTRMEAIREVQRRHGIEPPA
jgi:rubrerythrin